MPHAYVLVDAKIGYEDDVVRELIALPNVRRVNTVYGVYDVVTAVKAETMDKLKEIVTQKIRQMENVRSTLTLICTERGFYRDKNGNPVEGEPPLEADKGKNI